MTPTCLPQPVTPTGRDRLPTAAAPLNQHAIHVWRITPVGSGGADLWELLDGSERLRAARLRSSRDRSRFVGRRAVVRILLGRYLDRPPEDLTYVYTERGRPQLPADGRLDFSVSSSDDEVLVAVRRSGRIGVDVERIPSDFPWQELVPVALARDEAAELGALPSSLRSAGFLACWTRKEACLKALGLGLSVALDRQRVPVDPRVGSIRLSGVTGQLLRLVSWQTGTGAAAALAFDGRADAIRYYDGVRPEEVGDQV